MRESVGMNASDRPWGGDRPKERKDGERTDEIVCKSGSAGDKFQSVGGGKMYPHHSLVQEMISSSSGWSQSKREERENEGKGTKIGEGPEKRRKLMEESSPQTKEEPHFPIMPIRPTPHRPSPFAGGTVMTAPVPQPQPSPTSSPIDVSGSGGGSAGSSHVSSILQPPPITSSSASSAVAHPHPHLPAHQYVFGRSPLGGSSGIQSVQNSPPTAPSIVVSPSQMHTPLPSSSTTGSEAVAVAATSTTTSMATSSVVSESHPEPWHLYCDALSQNELALRFGLTTDAGKPWRFRDCRRGLFAKLTPQHTEFLFTHPEHSILRQRLPHKMTIRSFALRILLLQFHFVVCEGRVPSFWSKLNLPLIASVLPSESILLSPGVAQHAHHLMGLGESIDEAIRKARVTTDPQSILSPMWNQIQWVHSTPPLPFPHVRHTGHSSSPDEKRGEKDG
eukprot:TRINITY_DN126_c0_g1_i1.p1 TRINITY_DN126_c0_g1~~TRINITY_DN126_c0_g1_i1.p1  ORF type:complete len:448 (-),score=130.04 TRINITY_DN126_c0_g1_i1:449-1792(-)